MSKNNEKFYKWVRLLLIVGVTIILTAGATIWATGKSAGRYTEKVDRLERDFLANETADYMRDEDVEEQGKAIVRLETKVDNVQKTVDRIEGLLSDERTRTGRTQ